MNADYDKLLEREIERELKSLPDLKAPEALAARVMESIQRNASRPWYRQPWQGWPGEWQMAFAALLLLIVGALSFGGWEFIRSSTVSDVVHDFSGRLSAFNFIWDTLLAIAQALVLAVKKLGLGFMIACLILAVFSYLTCIGLGTVFLRYALSDDE